MNNSVFFNNYLNFLLNIHHRIFQLFNLTIRKICFSFNLHDFQYDSGINYLYQNNKTWIHSGIYLFYIFKINIII